MSDKPIYFPHLDTLRFIAFFLVFWQHGFAKSFEKPDWLNTEIFLSLTYTGGIGVQIFFVLSGFLITFLLLKEEEKNGTINIKHFYLRRILRIWPVYYIVMFSGIFILPHLASAFYYCGSIAQDILFLNNIKNDAVCNSANVNIAWSVAIEEQFYLLWPILFFLCGKNYRLLIFICFGLLLSSGIYVMNNPSDAYFSSFGNVLYLMTGCVGAILYQKKSASLDKKFWFSKILFLVLFIFMTSMILFKTYVSLWVLPIIYVYLIIYSIESVNSQPKVNLFSFLGKYTYGMYMYHPAIIIAVKIGFDLFELKYNESGLTQFAMATLALLLTVLISIVSYEFLEKRILRLKDNFSTVQTRV